MAIATTKMIENVIAGTTLVKIAQKANQDGNGANIVETYAKQNGNYPNMTVGNSTNADNAAEALKATQDAAGNNIQTPMQQRLNCLMGWLTNNLWGTMPYKTGIILK